MNLKKLKYNLIGDKNFYSKVIAILLPIVIQNTVTNIVSLVDNVMVGKVGTLQMSAVAIVNQLLFIFYLCIFGGLAGAGIFAAQYAGAKDDDGVKHCFRMKLYIAFLMLMIAIVIFIAIPDKLISIYFAEDTSESDIVNTLRYALGYFNVMLIGLLPFSISQVYGSTLREMGQTKAPMVASIIAILVNVVFNYILIFGNEGITILPFMPMGVKGAAIATVISRFAEALIIVIYTHSRKHIFPFIKSVYKSIKVPVVLVIQVLKKGTPLLINEFFWSLGMAMLMQCYSQRGLDVVAATNISSTVSNLFNVIYLSMGNAIAIMIGQYLGAGEIAKAKTSVWRLLALSLATCVVMGTLMFILAPIIPQIYNTSENVRNIAKQLLRVVAVIMPFYALSHGCYFVLRSGGKTMITLIFDCGYTWGLAYPVALCLALFTKVPIIPMYLCVQSLEILKCIVGLILVKKELWINKIISTTAYKPYSKG